MRWFIAALFLVAFNLRGAAAEPPKVVASPITRTHVTVTGQPIVVPDHPDIAVSTVTFPPGSRLPVHKHLYPHMAYVLQGVLTITNTETGKRFQIHQGEFLAEMENTWHYGANEGNEPVKLLIIDEIPQRVAGNVVQKK
jgi:quercetin dioxygenase-like cupin family protein